MAPALHDSKNKSAKDRSCGLARLKVQAVLAYIVLPPLDLGFGGLIAQFSMLMLAITSGPLAARRLALVFEIATWCQREKENPSWLSQEGRALTSGPRCIVRPTGGGCMNYTSAS